MKFLIRSMTGRNCWETERGLGTKGGNSVLREAFERRRPPVPPDENENVDGLEAEKSPPADIEMKIQYSV